MLCYFGSVITVKSGIFSPLNSFSFVRNMLSLRKKLASYVGSVYVKILRISRFQYVSSTSGYSYQYKRYYLPSETSTKNSYIFLSTKCARIMLFCINVGFVA